MTHPSFRWLLVLALCLGVASFVAMGSCFYAPPSWYRSIEHTRLNLEERRFAIVIGSTLQMKPRGLATFPDGGIPIQLREQADVWVCDPQEPFARRVATIQKPRWVGGGFDVWMIDWRSEGDRSTLRLRVSGRRGRTSTDTPRIKQYVEVEFDRSTGAHAKVVSFGREAGAQPATDMVNPGNAYGIMNLRRQGDTLSVWTDHALEWRSRFWLNRTRGSIETLGRIPKRARSEVDSSFAAYKGCPKGIRGVPSKTRSRITLGSSPVVRAAITRVDASCKADRYPIVGNEQDGNVKFSITASVWIDYEITGPDSGSLPGARIVIEAMTDSSEVLGSSSMPFSAYRGAAGEVAHTWIDGITPDEASRVARVVARWSDNGRL